MLKITSLNKAFDGKQVLSDISFTLDKGQILCLRGKSGAGKTTLVRCICNLERADSGTISISGVQSLDTDGRQNKEYQRAVGLVSQGFDLFNNLSVIKNITLSPVSQKLMSSLEAENSAVKLLESLGIADKALSYPCQLSGGEKQRVAVARACMLNPVVLFFDEPTSALDLQSSKEVASLITSVAKRGMSAVVISHDNDFCNMLDGKNILIKDGIIV